MRDEVGTQIAVRTFELPFCGVSGVQAVVRICDAPSGVCLSAQPSPTSQLGGLNYWASGALPDEERLRQRAAVLGGHLELFRGLAASLSVSRQTLPLSVHHPPSLPCPCNDLWWLLLYIPTNCPPNCPSNGPSNWVALCFWGSYEAVTTNKPRGPPQCV